MYLRSISNYMYLIYKLISYQIVTAEMSLCIQVNKTPSFKFSFLSHRNAPSSLVEKSQRKSRLLGHTYDKADSHSWYSRVHWFASRRDLPFANRTDKDIPSNKCAKQPPIECDYQKNNMTVPMIYWTRCNVCFTYKPWNIFKWVLSSMLHVWAGTRANHLYM